MAIPPDTRAPGDDHHVEDHNAISDTLTAQAATLAGLGTAATQPASAFAAVFSPLTYGAAGNGTTDDTTAVQAAITAAAAVHGTVDLGTSSFKTTSPLTLASAITIRGGSGYYIPGTTSGRIHNAVSDVFSITGTVSQLRIRDCYLSSDPGGGHIFACATATTLTLSAFDNVSFNQANAAKRIMHMPDGIYIQVHVRNCYLSGSPSASVEPWFVASSDNAVNSNTWANLWCAGNHMAVPFFRVENNGAGGYDSDNSFRDMNMEQCDGGLIKALSCTFLNIENVAGYDVTTYTGDLFSIGTGAGSNRSGYITIRNSGRRGGGLAGGVYDVNAASNVVSLVLTNVGPESGSGTYNVPAGAVITGVPSQDPLAIGMTLNFFPGFAAAQTALANEGFYTRTYAGGYAISNLNIDVAVSSGNISAATYANSGSGNSQVPGTRTATSGAIACPAIGMAAVSLGATVTPGLGDWLAISTDNATVSLMAGASSSTLGFLSAYFAALQASAHPLPSTPASLTYSANRYFYMRGS